MAYEDRSYDGVFGQCETLPIHAEMLRQHVRPLRQASRSMCRCAVGGLLSAETGGDSY